MSTLDPRARPFENQQEWSDDDPCSPTTTSTKKASGWPKRKDTRIRLSKTRSHLQEQEEMSSAEEEQSSRGRRRNAVHKDDTKKKKRNQQKSKHLTPAPPSPNVSSHSISSEEEEDEARDRMRRWEEIVDHAHQKIKAEQQKGYAPQDSAWDNLWNELHSRGEQTQAHSEAPKTLSAADESKTKQVDHGSEHLNDLDSHNLKKTLMHAIETTYPELDLLMRELAVDYYLSNPDDSPEDILNKAPKDFFLHHTPEEIGELLTEEQRRPWAALAEDVYNSARAKPAGVHGSEQQHPQSPRHDELESRLPAEL